MIVYLFKTTKKLRDTMARIEKDMKKRTRGKRWLKKKKPKTENRITFYLRSNKMKNGGMMKCKWLADDDCYCFHVIIFIY